MIQLDSKYINPNNMSVLIKIINVSNEREFVF